MICCERDTVQSWYDMMDWGACDVYILKCEKNKEIDFYFNVLLFF